MIQFKRADHINICVPAEKLEEARQFYTEIIGLKPIPRPDKVFHNPGYWFMIGDIGFHIGIEPAKPRSYRHIAFEVEDIKEARKKTPGKARSRNTSEEPVIPGRERFAFIDPFGNRMELLRIIR